MGLRSHAEMLIGRARQFSPNQHARPRALALIAASIATGDDTAMSATLHAARAHRIERGACYEIILQSYLFLGFPRMLLAVDVLNREMPLQETKAPVNHPPADEFQLHYANGLALCRQIYGSAFEPLRARIEAIAPEIFRWMIVEGYGKVMSRQGLDKVERELASVAFLVMEGYEQQLFSHLRGALNIGASEGLLLAVIEDIGPDAGAGYSAAKRILLQVGGK